MPYAWGDCPKFCGNLLCGAGQKRRTGGFTYDPGETNASKSRSRKIRELSQTANISGLVGMGNLLRETVAKGKENGPEMVEPDGQLGCGKYGCKDKRAHNSRCGHSGKRLRTSFEAGAAPGDRLRRPPSGRAPKPYHPLSSHPRRRYVAERAAAR